MHSRLLPASPRSTNAEGRPRAGGPMVLHPPGYQPCSICHTRQANVAGQEKTSSVASVRSRCSRSRIFPAPKDFERGLGLNFQPCLRQTLPRSDRPSTFGPPFGTRPVGWESPLVHADDFKFVTIHMCQQHSGRSWLVLFFLI